MLYENERLEKALIEMGFEEFTEIQAKTIPLMKNNKDVIGHSQTGTGKTAAFAIPILEDIDFDNLNIQAIVLCPTRELAVQVKREIDRIGKYFPRLKTVSIYGGEPISRQIGFLKKKPQIIVGTPGRTIDHINRRLIKLGEIKHLVLDEADEMLKMGFKEDIETILENTNPERQTVMFSATMPKQIIYISRKYMKDPEIVSVITDDETNKDITQYYYYVKDKNKLEAVSRLLHIYNFKLTLIFCNTKRKVDDITRELARKGYNADKIHGDLPQTTRMDVLNKFHNGVLDILVATDVAARGLDIKNVEAVINYDVPEKAEYYVHRIGRTGRIGRKGYSFTLVSRRETSRMESIFKFTKSNIKKRNIPTPEKVIQVKQEKQIEEIESIILTENTNMYDELSYQLLIDHEPYKIISALLSKIDKKDHSEQILGDINDNHIKENKHTRSKGMVRFHINIGAMNGINSKKLANIIVENSGLKNHQIKDIAVLQKFSFFSVQKTNKEVIKKRLGNLKYNGKRVSAQLARER